MMFLFKADDPSPRPLNLVERRRLRIRTARSGAGKGMHVDLSTHELHHVLHHGSYALVSAGRNPNHAKDSQLSDEHIASRHKQLGSNLKRQGFKYTHAKGKYGGEEDSYLVMVHNHDRKHIKSLGKKFNQDSVIMSHKGAHKMHYTTGQHTGKHHKGSGFEYKHDAKDYYTSIKASDNGHRRFSLNFDFNTIHKALLFLMEKTFKGETR